MKTGRDFLVGILRGGAALNSASSTLAASLLDWIQALTRERCLCSAADGPPEEVSCEDQKIWTVLTFTPSSRIIFFLKCVMQFFFSFCQRHESVFVCSFADVIQPYRLLSFFSLYNKSKRFSSLYCWGYILGKWDFSLFLLQRIKKVRISLHKRRSAVSCLNRITRFLLKSNQNVRKKMMEKL